MQRRQLLTLAAGGLAGAGAPSWVAERFTPERDRRLVEAGVQRAKTAGKPLLVLLVPETDEGGATQRGQLWGAFFGLASDEDLAELALCEVVCAPASELPNGALAEGALAVLLEADPLQREGVGVSAADLDGPLPSPYEVLETPPAVVQRLGLLRARLRAAIVPDAATIEYRKQRSLASLTGMEPWVLEGFWTWSNRPKLSSADRAAGFLYWEALRTRVPEARWRSVLGRAAALRLWEQDPAGASWHQTPAVCPPCGMGHVSDASRHFLRFFTESDPGPAGGR